MISDPEMAEEFDPLESREVMDDLVRRSPVRLLRRERWLWALGGAATACALWAVTVLMAGLGDQGTDLRGYRLDQEPCKSARLASLQKALALKSVPDVTDDDVLKHPALDQVHCSVAYLRDAGEESAGASGGHWVRNTTIGISVALHKKTDPRDEFDADRRLTDLGVVASDLVRPVHDLGDEAFLIAKDTGHAELRVVDGAAVMTLSLSVTSYYMGDLDSASAAKEPGLPEVSAYEAAMISDMRALMAGLR
ncbi:hypothetical protein ACIPSE_39460 [Streptomyces sp. NPDC090106]|uniref:hypothetical protein n=1 Tax=Streptomyces sp. NPDC090106 TaxID=3365946 RepID=UPI00380A358A